MSQSPAKAFPDRKRNSLDLPNLLERGSQKCCETFPWRLSNDSQPLTKFHGLSNHGIFRKSLQNCRQGMVQSQIMLNALPVLGRRPNRFPGLLQVDQILRDGSDETFAMRRIWSTWSKPGNRFG